MAKCQTLLRELLINDATMRDYQEVVIRFVKIVEKYPELYNPSHDSYRTRRAELAWDKIAESVRTELHEQCTVEEIKTKWKGIRSSFIRFKNKLQKTTESTPCKQYYLYDSLRFLEPFSKPRTHPKEVMDILRRQSTFEKSGNSDDEDSTRDEFAPRGIVNSDSWEVAVKSEVEEENENILGERDMLDVHFEEINTSNASGHDTEIPYDKAKKRKCEDSSDVYDSDDLHFFKSILPDIKDFSVKEKRKLKMGILKLIDEIEDSRVIINPFHEVSSSKIKPDEPVNLNK